MSRTRYEWTLADYAIWAAGAVTVPIYETSSTEQVEWILSDSAARAVFAETAAHAAMIGGIRTRLPDLLDVWEFDGLADLTAGGTAVTDEQLDQRRGSAVGRRPGHDHLHLRHHRAAQGLRADPPQPAGRRPQRDRRGAARGLRHRGRLDPAVPAAGPLLRPDHPGRLPGGGRRPGPLAGREHAARGAARVPADVPAGRAARVREDLQHRAAAGRRERDQEEASSWPRWTPRWPGARRWTTAARSGAAEAAARAVRQAGLRQDPGRDRRQGPVRGVRREPAGRAAGPLLPGRRGDCAGGLRADRDVGRGGGQPARPATRSARSGSRCRGSACGSPTTARS